MKLLKPLVLAGLIAAPAALFVARVGFADESDASKGYKAANDTMMEGMMTLPSTGDPDKDFVLMMMPHHEGAIAMAKVELQYGDDPEVRALAEAVVAAQAKEVTWMKDWLAKQPK